MLSEAPPGALRLRSFESTSMEESKAREKSLNGLSAWPTAGFPPHVLPSVSRFSPRARACPTRPFRIRIPRLSSFRRIYIYSFPLSTRTSLSLSRYPSLDGRLQGQPLVNLIISATPDKRRRQNVIPARSRSPFLVSNSKWCRCDLTHPYHIVGRGRFLSPAVPQSYSDFLSVRSFRTPSTFRRHPSIAPLTR